MNAHPPTLSTRAPAALGGPTVRGAGPLAGSSLRTPLVGPVRGTVGAAGRHGHRGGW